MDTPTKDKITLTYEHSNGTTHTASLETDCIFGNDVIDWLQGAFESFGFSAVSVRISEERSQSAYRGLDERMKRMLDSDNFWLDNEDKLAALRTTVSNAEASEDGDTGEMGLYFTKELKDELLFILDMEGVM